jgi:hypothetical protein
MPDESHDDPMPRRRLQFSLGSLMLLTAVVGLSIALVMMYMRLSRVERELGALQPLSPDEVARQFETNTMPGTVKSTVKDVRYSQSEDAFLVQFSWPDPQTGDNWSTDVKLTNDGFGRYFGQIRNSEFLKLLRHPTDSYTVVVEAPSPLKSR